MKNKELREFIKGDMLTQLEEIWRKARESYHESQKGDNIQGGTHCKTVEINLSRLIPDEKKEKEMTPMELFLLSASACLHDIGKVVPDGSGDWYSDHGKRAMGILLKEYDKLGLDKGQAIAVGYIVGVHNDGWLEELPDTPYVVGSEEINIIKLAAIFRLADMLDTGYNRAPEIVSAIKFPNEKIPSKWRGRQAITGWFLDEKGRIILQAVPAPEEVEAVHTLKAMMTEDLALISPTLKLYGFPAELGELDLGDVFINAHMEQKAKLDRPFPGMAFYTQREAAIFKGRDKEIEALLTQVSCWPISLLVGESGAGKTSLLHAGLFPRLELMKWKFAWTRPFENPVETIKKSLWLEFLEGKLDEKKSLLDIMKLAAGKCKPHKLLVVMDQFEDILNCSVPEFLEEFCLHLVAVQTGTVIPNLRVLISIRDDDLVKLNVRLFKKITGSARNFPTVELERLTIGGAGAALSAGLEQAGLGLDLRQEEGQRPLMDIILDDIRQGEDRLYPPYFQVVAETLCRKVDPGIPVITWDIYFHQLNGAGKIIARYLLDRLKEFGLLEEEAKKILICLTSSQGKKARKSLNELSLGTGIGIDELKAIMKEMIDMRLVHTIGEEEFEIIHDYLAQLVDKELVQEEDRNIKFLMEQLESYQQEYIAHKTPIMSPPFLARLYRNRVKVKIGEEKYPLILCTCLLKEDGLGWYWLKDIEKTQMLEMLKAHISHGKEDICKEAEKGFLNLLGPEDKKYIFNTIRNDNSYVKRVAGKALKKIATVEDRDTIISFLNDDDYFVCQAGVLALEKIAKPIDWEPIIEMLKIKDYCFQESAEEALLKIAAPGDRDRIFKLLEHYDDHIRQAAGKAFVKIATPDDRDKIFEMLEYYEANVRKVAGDAFIKIASTEDRKKIYEMLEHYEEDVRKAAVKAFVKIVTPEDQEKIVDMLKDEDYNIQQAAKEALVKIATPGDWEKNINMMRSKEYNSQDAAVKAFLKIAAPEKRERIIEMLKDESYSKYITRKAFVKIATPEDREIILEMVKHEDTDIIKAGVMAFVKIATPEDREKILEMMKDGDIDVIKAGAKAFLKIAGPGDHESLLDQLAEQCQGWSLDQLDIFKVLSELDTRLYCPYYEEKKEENEAETFWDE